MIPSTSTTGLTFMVLSEMSQQQLDGFIIKFGADLHVILKMDCNNSDILYSAIFRSKFYLSST